MIHLYEGDGKGKTTAAMGLCLRMLALGKTVIIVHFLKNANSGEDEMLGKLGAKIYAAEDSGKFFFQMNEAEKEKCRRNHAELLGKITNIDCDLLVLDEICASCELNVVDSEQVRAIVLGKSERTEIVLTGRNPQAWMVEIADYHTEMSAKKHPFDKGASARHGIEY